MKILSRSNIHQSHLRPNPGAGVNGFKADLIRWFFLILLKMYKSSQDNKLNVERLFYFAEGIQRMSYGKNL